MPGRNPCRTGVVPVRITVEAGDEADVEKLFGLLEFAPTIGAGCCSRPSLMSVRSVPVNGVCPRQGTASVPW